MGDVRLKLFHVGVRFLDGSTATATAEGNNAAWFCTCHRSLIGRCYFQFGHDCHTKCECGRTYRVKGDDKKRAIEVVEE